MTLVKVVQVLVLKTGTTSDRQPAQTAFACPWPSAATLTLSKICPIIRKEPLPRTSLRFSFLWSVSQFFCFPSPFCLSSLSSKTYDGLLALLQPILLYFLLIVPLFLDTSSTSYASSTILELATSPPDGFYLQTCMGPCPTCFLQRFLFPWLFSSEGPGSFSWIIFLFDTSENPVLLIQLLRSARRNGLGERPVWIVWPKPLAN